jgi:heme exporter protein D
MIDLGPHAVFIIWAYAGVTLAVGVLIAWRLAEARQIDRRITALEAQGVRRRSETKA